MTETGAEANARPGRHYCASCGEVYAASVWACPRCGAAWQRFSLQSLRALVAALSELDALSDDDAEAAGLSALRATWEERLVRTRPTSGREARRPWRRSTGPGEPTKAVDLPLGTAPEGSALATAATAVAAPGAAGAQVTPAPTHSAAPKDGDAGPPRPPSRAPGQVVLEWAAERQADILLYLGALLLSVSAILFVAYQGGALAGLVRFVILSGYTIGFIGLGLVLHRWERVREAGPVFLLVGALLVPLQFVALRTQVLDEGTLPTNVLWLLGSTVTGGFYYVLTWRGLGRLYVIPAAIATYLAWGSLAWVLGLPDEWYGAWFIGLVLPFHLLAVREMLPGRRWVERLTLTTAACAIVYAHVRAGSGFGDAGQLPAAYALLLGAAAATVRLRPTVPALASLPALFALAAATTLWAAFDIGWWWQGSLTVVAGLGYLVLALADEPARARRWALVAAIAGALGLAAAHLGVTDAGSTAAALPVAYGFASAGVAVAVVRWRSRWYEGPLALPPLLALTAITAWWAAAGERWEWWGVLAAAGSLGYLTTAFLDQGRGYRWASLAAATFPIGIGLSHLGVTLDGASHWGLPAAYGTALVGVAGALVRWRLAWPIAPAALPPVATLTIIAAVWAAGGTAWEWYPSIAAVGAAGYLVIAQLDRERSPRIWGAAAGASAILALALAHIAALNGDAEGAALPLAYTIVLAATAGAFVRWRWREAIAALPPLATLTASSTWWAAGGHWEWYAAFAAVGSLGYLLTAHLDAPRLARLWGAAAALLAIGAIAFAHVAMGFFEEADVGVLPTVYAVVTAGTAIAFIRWGLVSREVAGALPSLIALAFSTTVWATLEPNLAWFTPVAAAAGAGYLVLAEFDAGARRLWRSIAATFGLAAIVAAHAVAPIGGTPDAQLPLTYAVLLVGVTWDAVRRRDGSALAVPALLAMSVPASLWATGVGAHWWGYSALVQGAVLGASPLVARELRPFHRFAPAYALVLVVTPVALLAVAYEATPWHGTATALLAALTVLWVGLRNGSSIGEAFVARAGARARAVERHALFYLAAALALSAIAFLNLALDLQGAEGAWAYFAFAAVVWLSAVLAGGRGKRIETVLVPIATAASVVAAGVAFGDPGALLLILATSALLSAFAAIASGRWPVLGLTALFAAAATAALWDWRAIDVASLPLAYAGEAALAWAVLMAARRYPPAGERGFSIFWLSWGPWALAGLTALAFQAQAADELIGDDSQRTLAEFATLALVLTAAGAAVAIEGIWVRRERVWLPGTLVLVLGLLFAIASREYENPQAYTVPIALYLLFLGLSYRTSPPLVRVHMGLHEALLVAGVLVLVLPAAAQSIESEAGVYGFETIAAGLVFLTLGLILHARWLIPSGVLTLSGVALRWATGGYVDIPYWLVLGAVGMVLLGGGLLLLSQRERWDALRRSAGRWWLETPASPGDWEPIRVPHAVLLSGGAAAVVIVALAFAFAAEQAVGA